MSMDGEVPPYRETLGGKLLAAREAVMGPVRNILREFDVTEQQWRVLRALADGGPLEASKVAKAAILRPPSLTRILRELVDRGLIERSQDPDDGRRTIVAISPAGQEVVERTLAETGRIAALFAAEFGPERLHVFRSELTTFTETIHRMVEAAKREAASQPPSGATGTSRIPASEFPEHDD